MLRPYLELIRLPAVFTAPADVLLGLALASAAAGQAIPLSTALILVIASAAIYCAGMAANDVFDAAVGIEHVPFTSVMR